MLRLMSKVRQTAAFVAPMSSAATTTSFSASASIATGPGNDLSLRDRSNCARASKTWNRNSPCGVVVSICSVSETCPRVFSVTAARHCPTAAGAVLGGIRWLPLSGVLALSAYATKMGRSLVPAVSPDTVYDLSQKGELPGRKVGRKWITTKTAVLRWIENTSADDALARAVERGDRDALTKALNNGKVRVRSKGD